MSELLLAACENVIEPDGVPCTGTLHFEWGMVEAACDTCGARCGVAVAKWVSVVSALQHLQEANASLTAARDSLTDIEKFNTGWRVDTALQNIRESIETVSKPERMIPLS